VKSPIPDPSPIDIDAIRAAYARLPSEAKDTPLVPLRTDGDGPRILLKLENLGPIGSFKLRGAGNALSIDDSNLDAGVFTASAGNMAQAVARVARQRGVPCWVVVPDHAPKAKLDAIARLGAEIIPVPFDEWWDVIVTHRYEGLDGRFVHPVCDRDVMAGNGTVGLEIVEAVPDVDAVVVPYGGGGLSSGIASAVRALAPDAIVYGAEVETATPLAAAFAAGEPVDVDYKTSWVDGIGSGRVLDEMWPIVSSLLTGSLVVSLDEVAAAVRLLATGNNVVAEGAGAASVAAALNGSAGSGTVVCVISGGNINPDALATILMGSTPGR
jgi:threonine dehydratase